ncbi:MAG: 6-carboxytetrahydropterin synthase [Candidatus Caldarchaeum sp.]
MVRIGKEFTFSASHRLEKLPQEHPCSRLHGHNYTVKLELTGEIRDNGMFIDYRDLDSFKKLIDSLDHADLNSSPRLPWHIRVQPTAEQLAIFFAEQALALFQDAVSVTVTVQETPKTWATVTLAR